jgi:hypothetical protein
MSIILANQSYSANYVTGSQRKVVTLAAATNYVLTESVSGSLCSVTGGGATSTITLPLPTIPGLFFDFVLTANNIAIIGIVSPSAGTAKGFGLVSAGGAAASHIVGGANVRLNFTATALAHDRISCVSDGTNWQFTGHSGAAAGLAFA